LDIKVGVKGSETTFHYVNVTPVEGKARSEHMTVAGVIKTQECPTVYQTYSIVWLVLTKAERNSLLSIIRSSSLLNLQFEDEDYTDHTVKFQSPVPYGYSKNYPGYYEVIATCVEVG
jgi:hypothetical protein